MEQELNNLGLHNSKMASQLSYKVKGWITTLLLVVLTNFSFAQGVGISGDATVTDPG